MKNIFLLLLSTIILFGCEEEIGVSKAQIMAKDFVEADLLFPEDAEFSNGGGEEDGVNGFHIVYDLRAKNILGLTIPMKVSVRLSYKGKGEWTDEANWDCHSISYLNLYTGEEERNITKSYAELGKKLEAEAEADMANGNENKSAVAQKTSQKNEIKLGGITFEVIERTKNAVRVYSKKKIRKLSDVNKIYKDMPKQGIDIVQFCDKPNAARGEEYAAINGNLYLDHERDIIKTLK